MPTAKRPLIPLDKFPHHLQKFIAPDSPIAATKLVIQGLVPINGAIKICAFYQAAHLHEVLYPLASTALAQLPVEEIVNSLDELPPPIIDWVAESCQRSPECSVAIFALPQVAMSTMMRLLSTVDERVAVHLADNQVKLMSNIALLQSLCLNPSLPHTVQNKLVELAQYQGVDTTWLDMKQEGQISSKSTQLTSAKINTNAALAIDQSSQSVTVHKTAKVSLDIPVVKTTLPTQSNPLSLVSNEGRAPSPQKIARQPLDLGIFPSQVQKFLIPEAPPQVLNLVLSGLFPMPSEQRILALYHLALSRLEVTDRCAESVRHLDYSTLVETVKVLKHTQTLDWLADICLGAEEEPQYSTLDKNGELVSALSMNAETSEVTMARLALYTTAVGCERIVLNQQRLLNQPSIIHSLYYNPSFETVQADRILELAAREGVDLSWLPDAQEIITEIVTEDGSSNDELLQEAIRSGADIDPKDAAIQAVLQEHAARRSAATASDEEDGKPKKGYALIQSLNVAQKIRLALLGSQSDRALLVKDANKVVSRAAIRSPAVSVSEALLYARNHSLNATIIEYIARNRKWMQNYRLKVQIVLNPKTPVNISLNALNSLRPAELRSVSQSHNVSGVVSQRAKELIKKRRG